MKKVLLRKKKLVATRQIKKTEKVVACFYCIKTSTYVLSKSYQMGYDQGCAELVKKTVITVNRQPYALL